MAVSGIDDDPLGSSPRNLRGPGRDNGLHGSDRSLVVPFAVIILFIVLGMAFRIVRYAQNLPLWSDECLLSVNFIDRGYAELIGPLENGQIAPILFLWIQRLAVDLGGFSEWSLRFFPLVCGLASVFLFWRLARRVYEDKPVSLFLAVGILAVSVHPIRHAAEAKPYASDLLVALLLLVPAVEWVRRPRQVGWLWMLCALSPWALALSNPAAFVAGGISLALLRPVWTSRDGQARRAFVCLGLTLLVSFWGLHSLVGHDQSAMALEGLRSYWAASFPPWRDPLHLPLWLISAHTGSALAYPGGGARGGSLPTLAACLIGASALIRRGDRPILACLIAPLGVALLAASLHLYPYGEARLMQFAAPAICLLCGGGAGAVLSRVRGRLLQKTLRIAVLCGLVICGVIPQVVSSLKPYRTLYDHEVREFARRFWKEQAIGADLACGYLDYGVGRGRGWHGKKAWYLCNQVIYSPSRRQVRGDLGVVRPANRPLRCVLFDEPPESAAVQAWLAGMEVDLALEGTRTYHAPVTLVDGHVTTEEWRVFDFVTRRDRAERALAGRPPEHPMVR